MTVWVYIVNWGGGAVTGAIAGAGIFRWLGKAALEKYKASLSQELAGWKAGYQRALDENRIRFSRLHADRVDAIKVFYSRLAEAEDALRHYVAQKGDGQLRDVAMSRRIKAAEFYQRNRIFFTEDECKLIEPCINWNLEGFFQVGASNVSSGCSPAAGDSETSPVIAIVREKIPELRRALERAFRDALGMAEIHGVEDSI